MTSFTPNLRLPNPTPFAPSNRNTWGTTENTGRTLLDAAITTITPVNCAGSSNITLTAVNGSADQTRSRRFVFSGALTGNISVFWPTVYDSFFSAINNCTGAYTLTLAVTGTPGAVVVLAPGQSASLFSDGTNIGYDFIQPGASTGQVVTTGSSITAVPGFNYLELASAGLFTFNLPAIPIPWLGYTIIDNKGIAGTYPITVAGNGNTISGVSSLNMIANYSGMTFSYSGANWGIS